MATWSGGTISVSSVERDTSYTRSFGDIIKAPSGKAFVFITVTCSNTGSTSFLTGPSYFLLTDSAGHLYKNQTYGGYSFSKPYPNAILTPSVKVTGKILWLVPVSASGLEVSCLLDASSNPPVIAKWKLPR